VGSSTRPEQPIDDNSEENQKDDGVNEADHAEVREMAS
jgi:hypothetical protein